MNISIKSSQLLAVAGVVGAIAFTFALPVLANAAVIYNSIPNPQAVSDPSEGFQATQTSELGDNISFVGTDRTLTSVDVLMNSWACQTGSWIGHDCGNDGISPGYTHPITLTIYNVDHSNPLVPAVGSVITTVTQNITVPWRPAADPTCPNGGHNPPTCNNGFNFVASFPIPNVVVPNEVIYGVSFNTQSWGAAPIGVDGPYNSLNMSVPAGGATVGTDINPDAVFWNTDTDAGAGGHDLFRQDTGWTGQVPAALFNAITPVGPVFIDSNGNHAYDTGEASFNTIQAAVNAAVAGDMVQVTSGTYTENVSIPTGITLTGNATSTTSIVGQVTVNAASTTVTGFSITNPNGNFGVLINGVGNVNVSGNSIDSVGTGTATGNTYGIWFQDQNTVDASGITVNSNTISNIGKGTTSGNGTNGGIGIGDSTGTSNLTNVVISGNTITNINANTTAVSPGKGAYGIIVNHANHPADGSTSAQITNNSICTLDGRWAHGIGLEGNTPNTTVSGNTICALTSTGTPTDAWAITVQDDTSATSSSLVITNNSFSGNTGGIQNAAVAPSCSLTSDQSSVTVGSSIVLSWACTNTMGTTTIDNSVGNVGAAGTTTVALNTAQTYNFHLSATGADASSTPVTASVSVTANAAPTSGGGGGGGNGPIVGGGGGGGGGTAVALPNNGGAAGGQVLGASTSTGSGGQVLGASTFFFAHDLTIGSTGNDVIELQKLLISLGYSIPLLTSGNVPYGYFGEQTRAAVAAFQVAHGIKPTAGYFGPITRGVVNQGSTTLQSLQLQLQALLARIAAIKAGTGN